MTTSVLVMQNQWIGALAVLLTVSVSACGGTPRSTPLDSDTTAGSVSTPLGHPVAALIGAGDIATSSGDDAATAAIIEQHPAAVVFTTGDNAYPDGTAEEFSEYYDRYWGAFKDRTRPAIGNHDAHSDGAAPYFAYFGAQAGTPGEGWYSYDLGTWHVIVLNSECGSSGLASCDDQLAWLQEDLVDSASNCKLAYWHKPVFNAGRHHGYRSFADEWTILDDAGVDLVLNGHDHNYQRFAPQDADANADPAGIREFIIGSGGAGPYAQTADPENLEEFYGGHGVLKLDLFELGYRWTFIPTRGPYTDEGTGTCRDS